MTFTCILEAANEREAAQCVARVATAQEQLAVEAVAWSDLDLFSKTLFQFDATAPWDEREDDRWATASTGDAYAAHSRSSWRFVIKKHTDVVVHVFLIVAAATTWCDGSVNHHLVVVGIEECAFFKGLWNKATAADARRRSEGIKRGLIH